MIIDFPKRTTTETVRARLHCPRCGSDYLHQGKVAPVRGGITIAFECEGCWDDYGRDDGDLELVIITDKGNTDLYWRFRPVSGGVA